MVGLFIGRFQPLHHGHLTLVRHIMEETDTQLILAIGSAQESHTLDNPFTAGERYSMIADAIEDEGIKGCYPIPVPDINRYNVWVSHVESYLPSFDLIYTNSPLTTRLFSEKGYEVKGTPLFNRQEYSGTEIRRRIIESESWQDLVPRAVARVIEKIDGAARLRELANKDVEVEEDTEE